MFYKVTANQAKTKEGLYPKPFLSKVAPEHDFLKTCKP